MAINPNESPEQHDSFSANIIYQWWCPRCKIDHYTPYCPIENYERLAKLWKYNSMSGEFMYEHCPHCGQIIKKE